MNETKDTKRENGNAKRMILLAGICLLVIGAGLYALFGGTGNDQDGRLAAAGDETHSCQIDKDIKTKIDAAAHGDVAAFKATDRPFSVASFKFLDKNGTQRTFGDWKGKTVLFNLWATWCAPCRAEMPALDALQKELGGEKFEVVPVSVDLGDAAKPKKFYKETGMQHVGFFHDPELATLNALKKNGLAYGLPATLLFDGNGCVLGTLNGPAEWAGADAQKLIKAALEL